MFKAFTPALFKKNKGFTLVELMVVSGIIIFMTAVVLINYRPGGQQLALDRSASKLAQDIRRAQEMAMSSKKDDLCDPTAPGYNFQGGYGIRIHRVNASSSYILFVDCNNDHNYAPGEDEILEEIDLEPGVKIVDSSANHLRISFSPPDPVTNFQPLASNAWIELGISGYPKTIRVNEAGLIYVE